MLNEKEVNKNRVTSENSVSELHFKIILKFWKKESIHSDILLLETDCITPLVFIDTIKDKFNIKNSHCLEEIWVIQLGKEYDKELEWIKDTHGRIKLDIPLEYKEFLLKRAIKDGSRPFEDPKY
ncbi:MAG: hypothetical protein IPO21_12650 [Bacteroidales bacterium]|nr:hypothetical protein [Bacteroidales bacterium]